MSAPPTRSSKRGRQRAALELRTWSLHGRLGLGDVAWAAVCAAAERLGFASVEAASHAGCSIDLWSEAIEDVESDD